MNLPVEHQVDGWSGTSRARAALGGQPLLNVGDGDRPGDLQ